MKDEGGEDQPLYVSEQQHLSEESLREIGRSLGSQFPTVQDTSVESITYVCLTRYQCAVKIIYELGRPT
jgi:hypothetical protein